MVFKYKCKTDRGGSWTEASMLKAMNLVRIYNYSIGQAAVQFNIPFCILQKHLKKDSAKKVITFSVIFEVDMPI